MTGSESSRPAGPGRVLSDTTWSIRRNWVVKCNEIARSTQSLPEGAVLGLGGDCAARQFAGALIGAALIWAIVNGGIVR